MQESTDRGIGRGHARLLRAAATATFLLVVMGGTVCVTGSTLGCPDWPACYGRLVPPARADSIIEYTHRLLALIAAPLVLAAAGLGWWRARHWPWVGRGPIVAVGLFLAVGVFGAFAVLTGLPPVLAALDLGFALLALALMVAAATVAGASRGGRAGPGPLRLRDGHSRLAAATTGGVWLVLVLGVLVAEPGSIARCIGWPLYGGEELAATTGGALQGVRVSISVVAAAGILALVPMSWRRRPADRTSRTGSLVAAGLLLAEIGLGLRLASGVGEGQPGPAPLVVHVALAVGLWAQSVALTVTAALARREEPAPGQGGGGARGRSEGRAPVG